MERTSIEHILKLYGDNFIGAAQLQHIHKALGIVSPGSLGYALPEIPFAPEVLERAASTHILFLAIPQLAAGGNFTINAIRKLAGTDPAIYEPCMYNQDWYALEAFASDSFEPGWHLVSRDILDSSRAVAADTLMAQQEVALPSAALLTYLFFAYYLHTGDILLRHDYAWCCDLDANGDRIYVGKYIDPLGINKNGFEIHRHLSIKKNYGALSVIR